MSHARIDFATDEVSVLVSTSSSADEPHAAAAFLHRVLDIGLGFKQQPGIFDKRMSPQRY